MCADVFDGTDKVYPGGESLNFAANICRETTADIVIVGAVGYHRKIFTFWTANRHIISHI